MLAKLKLACLYVKIYAGFCWKAISPVMLWLAVAWFFEISSVLTLLVYLAVSLNVWFMIYFQRSTPSGQPDAEQDFYVVTDDEYQFDITRGNRWSSGGIKPKFVGTTYAFDNFEAARIKYHSLEAEHYSFENCSFLSELENRDLSYHEKFGYDEKEARLWVVSARSKTEAYDKVWYDESRKHLTGDGRQHDLLLVTNNEPRRRLYLDWWHGAMAEARNQPA